MRNLRQDLAAMGYAVFRIDSSVKNRQLPDNTKLNMLILCIEGKAVIEGNMQCLTLVKGARMLAPHLVQTKILDVTPDFEAWVMVMEESFSRDISVGVPTELLGLLFAHPVKVVDDEQEWKLLNSLMESMHLYDTMNSSKRSLEVSGCIFRSMLLVMAESEFKSGNFTKMPMYTMADTYFREFVRLVADHSATEHEVAFYADRLNITTKYLSDICKQKTNKGAKELISGILISKLKRDIKMSGLSLKEISYQYGFADQSSMGKFFRKMTGLSPLAFKQSGGLMSD